MQNAEDDSFVDVDEDSYSEREEETVPQERKRKERKDAEERKQENQLLDKIKTAMAENNGDIELGEDEAYCEACCLKLNGDMDISVLVWERTDLKTHIESSSHLARLKVLFKSNLFSSSRLYLGCDSQVDSKNVCTTCCVSFGTPELLFPSSYGVID